jgi:hypothetical protein
LDRRFSESQNQSGRHGEENNSLPLLRIEPQLSSLQPGHYADWVKDWRKQWKISVMIAGIWAEKQTLHLPNKSTAINQESSIRLTTAAFAILFHWRFILSITGRRKDYKV